MDKVQVQFLPDDVTVEAPTGALLLDVAMDAGVFLPAACGGSGTCGHCKVRILQGSVENGSIAASDAECVLACQSRLVSNVSVQIPEVRFGRKIIPRDEAKRMRVTAAPMESPIVPEFDPMTERVLIQAPAPGANDNVSDYDRIVRTLRSDHELYPVTADLEILRELPITARKEDWKITACLTVEDVPESKSKIYRIFNALPGHATGPRTAVAVDIGTTSLWGELIDVETGRVLATSSRYNPQIAMGDDVISRVVFALKKGGRERLQKYVVKGLNEIIDELLVKSAIAVDSVDHMVAAGNTVMTHLFLGLYPKFLRESPYVPAAQNVGPVPAGLLGLNMPARAPVMVFPGVASYVGGDIVSGVLANGMWDSDLMTLFVDIGTNGEIVAGNRELLITASCSAGPAFEGGGLEYGMRAAPGAIESVLVDPETLEPMIKTIGAIPAVGVCGSGIINIVAQMLKLGVLDQNGKFAENPGASRVRDGRNGREYVISRAHENALQEDIVLTEVDLDNIIRAKAAMFSGYTCLLSKIGLTVDALDRVIIAGAFGSFINIDHAITIGLLPDIPRDKFSFIGNASLKGAKLAAIDRGLFQKSGDLARTMTNVELSEDYSYMDNFIAALFFPHTREDLFPSVHLKEVFAERSPQ